LVENREDTRFTTLEVPREKLTLEPAEKEEVDPLSDDDDYMEPADNPEGHNVLLRLPVMRTRKERIRKLFFNNEKVY